MKTLHQDPSEFNVLFVHSELDDYGLTANEFRIYAHLARRAGKDGAWPAVDSMADKCRMNRDTAYRCLKRLKELNLVHSIVRPGTTNIYVLTARSQWKDNDGGVSEKEGHPLNSDTPTHPKAGDTPCRKREDTGVSENRGHKGYPSEGNPLKDNTAVGQELIRGAGEISPQKNSESSSKTDKFFQKSSSTPIERKAFALSDHLESKHWDQCRVSYKGSTAYSYALKALTEGHDEANIVKAYQVALHEANEATAIEMDCGKRHRQHKASPALTVWLARQYLGKDIKSIEERWHLILPRLQQARQHKAREDARVEAEALHAAPAIKAWFEKKYPKGEDTALSSPSTSPSHSFPHEMMPSTHAPA